MIVIDASVAVKWFVPEPMSDEAVELLVQDEPRVAPEHILVEVGHTLLRLYRSGDITLDHAERSVEALSSLVQLVPTRALASAALRIAAEASCTNYDALYVAASEHADARLVTADRRLVMQIRATRWRGRIFLLDSPYGANEPG